MFRVPETVQLMANFMYFDMFHIKVKQHYRYGHIFIEHNMSIWPKYIGICLPCLHMSKQFCPRLELCNKLWSHRVYLVQLFQIYIPHMATNGYK